jgi:cardiolipin synthase
MGNSDEDACALLEQQGAAAQTQSRYLEQSSLCPAHTHTETTYFPLGDEMFVRIKEELEKAQRFIFLQYFIIRPGVMWNEILEILCRKASQGVEVRVMYDDVGCLYTLPSNYERVLREKGIACKAFNRYRPVVSLRLNNRDHRKILIVDGEVGFTGGINLADEYINVEERFGHWKDSGVMLRGEAVWNFTVMFLSAWSYNEPKQEDVQCFRPQPGAALCAEDGVVQPYDDSPLDDQPVGANVYHNLISKATRYVYLTTPYLVIDDDMASALCVAAQSGVDVRIITPHIPDKKIVFELTRAHYLILLEAGVRIFEYTPGFIHAKNFVVDDQFATVGTVNMDYRSLYLHFECGVWMSGSSAIADVRRDFLDTQAVSQEITLETARLFSQRKRLYHALLRAFAPLL